MYINSLFIFKKLYDFPSYVVFSMNEVLHVFQHIYLYMSVGAGAWVYELNLQYFTNYFPDMD